MFHGLLRRKEVEMPTTTPLQVQRQRQIDNFRTNMQNVTEVVKDVDYRIQVPISSDVSVTLIILLPPHFPQDKPVVHVTPPVTHPWVNEQQQILGCPGLRNFSMHSDLGKVISDIIEEFQKRHPTLDRLAPPVSTSRLHYSLMPHDTTSMAGFPLVTAGGSSLPVQSNDFLSVVSSSINMTDMTACFPILKEMSKEQLEALIADENRITELVEELPVMKLVDQQMATIVQSNEELARKNLERQPEIEKLKQSLLDKAEESLVARKEFEDMTNQFIELVDKYSPRAISKNLKQATLSVEEESDNIAQQFLDEKLRPETFLCSFMEKRTLFHLRKTKEEKLHSQLHELRRLMALDDHRDED